jgi:hypothetical protein
MKDQIQLLEERITQLEAALQESTELYEFMRRSRCYWKEKFVNLAHTHYGIPTDVVRTRHKEF